MLTKSESLRFTRSFIPHNRTHIPIQDDGRGKAVVLTKSESLRLIRSFIPHNQTHGPIQDDG
jgi:hypothetical protein